MFACREVEYLGRVIFGEGVQTHPKKILAMQEWPIPKDVKSLRGFLSLTCYYRKFVKVYGYITAPLTALLKKNYFSWNLEAKEAFQQLKLAMFSPPVLALLDFSKTFIVECDAGVRPIAFHSQVLKGRVLALSTYEKEFLALITVLKKWRTYLVGNAFVIKTDQQSLKYLLHQRIGTPIQQKWLSKLLGYTFVVEYKKGTDNVVADALSRKEGESVEAQAQRCTDSLVGDTATNLNTSAAIDLGTLCIISFPTPTWVAELEASYAFDPTIQSILSTFQAGGIPPQGFSLVNGLLFFKGRIYLGPTSIFKFLILQHVHNGPFGGHLGYLKTIHRVQQDFYWFGMMRDLRQYKCDICQWVKYENYKPTGLLHPLPIPSKPWLAVSIHFIEGLPRS